MVECAVRCVAIFIVDCMDVCTLLEQHIAHSHRSVIPYSWGGDPALQQLGTIECLVGVVRHLDDRSDALLLALLKGEARGDPLCSAAIITALLPLVLARCRGDRDRVDDYVAELALVIATVEVAALERSQRRVGSVLLDRAWDEVRRPVRRPPPVDLTDPAELVGRHPSPGLSPEDEALGWIAVDEARSAVVRVGAKRTWVIPAWNAAVELADRDDRDRVEARRWKYVRGVLRLHVAPEIAA